MGLWEHPVTVVLSNCPELRKAVLDQRGTAPLTWPQFDLTLTSLCPLSPESRGRLETSWPSAGLTRTTDVVLVRYVCVLVLYEVICQYHKAAKE